MPTVEIRSTFFSGSVNECIEFYNAQATLARQEEPTQWEQLQQQQQQPHSQEPFQVIAGQSQDPGVSHQLASEGQGEAGHGNKCGKAGEANPTQECSGRTAEAAQARAGLDDPAQQCTTGGQGPEGNDHTTGAADCQRSRAGKTDSNGGGSHQAEEGQEGAQRKQGEWTQKTQAPTTRCECQWCCKPQQCDASAGAATYQSHVTRTRWDQSTSQHEVNQVIKAADVIGGSHARARGDVFKVTHALGQQAHAEGSQSTTANATGTGQASGEVKLASWPAMATAKKQVTHALGQQAHAEGRQATSRTLTDTAGDGSACESTHSHSPEAMQVSPDGQMQQGYQVQLLARATGSGTAGPLGAGKGSGNAERARTLAKPGEESPACEGTHTHSPDTLQILHAGEMRESKVPFLAFASGAKTETQMTLKDDDANGTPIGNKSNVEKSTPSPHGGKIRLELTHTPPKQSRGSHWCSMLHNLDDAPQCFDIGDGPMMNEGTQAKCKQAVTIDHDLQTCWDQFQDAYEADAGDQNVEWKSSQGKQSMDGWVDATDHSKPCTHAKKKKCKKTRLKSFESRNSWLELEEAEQQEEPEQQETSIDHGISLSEMTQEQFDGVKQLWLANVAKLATQSHGFDEETAAELAKRLDTVAFADFCPQ